MSRQSKWLIGLVVLLVVVNVALVATMWLKKDHDVKPRGGNAKDYLAGQLSLSNEQKDSFESLRKEHFGKMQGYQDEMRHLKDSFFDQLHRPNAKPDSIAQRIGEMQARIDLETFDHFAKLRSILNEEQKKKFDNIIQDVLRTMAPGNGPPPGRRDGEQGLPPPDGPPH